MLADGAELYVLERLVPSVPVSPNWSHVYSIVCSYALLTCRCNPLGTDGTLGQTPANQSDAASRLTT